MTDHPEIVCLSENCLRDQIIHLQTKKPYKILNVMENDQTADQPTGYNSLTIYIQVLCTHLKRRRGVRVWTAFGIVFIYIYLFIHFYHFCVHRTSAFASGGSKCSETPRSPGGSSAHCGQLVQPTAETRSAPAQGCTLQ